MSTIRIGGGHLFSRADNTFVDACEVGPLLIRIGKRKWLFEFSEMFGPTLLKQNFDTSQIQPISENHPFWASFDRWVIGGRKCRKITTRRGRQAIYLCHVPAAMKKGPTE